MILPENIRPLSDFQRNSKAHVRRLKRTGEPELLTVNGKAAVVIQDAASYQQLLKELHETRELAAIRIGLEQAKRGEGRPMRRVLEEIAARSGIDLRKTGA